MRVLRGKTEVRQFKKDFAQSHRPQVELVFMLQDWSDAYNVGGMFRVADACGAREIIFTGKTPTPPNPMIAVTSLGHHRRVPWRIIVGHEEAALALKAEGFRLVVVEIADGAVCYSEYDYAGKVCLVLGNEENGIYPKVLRHRDAAVFVPMFGKGRSMNVHVAGAIVGYQAVMSSLTSDTDSDQ